MTEKILRTSLERQWTVTIMYQGEKEITKRNIRVLAIDGKDVRAHCYLRDQVRTFRMDRILAAAFVKVNSPVLR